jgi:hypothetical protein
MTIWSWPGGTEARAARSPWDSLPAPRRPGCVKVPHVPVQFPAFCPNCGLIFQSRMLSIVGGTQRLTLSGNRETCPRCGAWAELPDGTFNVIGDTIEVLGATELTRERLSRLQAILKDAEAGRISADEAARAVAEQVPSVAPLLERYGQQMQRALFIFLLAVVQILAGQALAEARDDSATRDDVRRAVAEAVQQAESGGSGRSAKQHSGTLYQDRAIGIVDLVGDRSPPVIEGCTFVDCRILGPAVVKITSGSFVGCSFDGDADSLFWQLSPDQDRIIGAIQLTDCHFGRCQFERIGFVDRNRELRSRIDADAARR